MVFGGKNFSAALVVLVPFTGFRSVFFIVLFHLCFLEQPYSFYFVLMFSLCSLAFMRCSLFFSCFCFVFLSTKHPFLLLDNLVSIWHSCSMKRNCDYCQKVTRYPVWLKKNNMATHEKIFNDPTMGWDPAFEEHWSRTLLCIWSLVTLQSPTLSSSRCR